MLLTPYKRGTPPSLPGSDRRYLAAELGKIERAFDTLYTSLTDPWVISTPTVVGGGVPGAFAATSVVHTRQIGTSVDVMATVTVTNVGTATYVQVPYPVTPIMGTALNGQGHTDGLAYSWHFGGVLFKYDGTTAPVAQTYLFSGSYEAAP